MAQPIRFQGTVSEVHRHDSDTASFVFQSQKRLPRFLPGQFVHLALDPFDPSGFWPESRIFSVANAVADRRTLRLTISRQGAYTARVLSELGVGDMVWLKGPYGDFVIDGGGSARKVVLIAGGTGVTPFCALMDQALQSGTLPVDQVTLHYGVRTPELLIYRDLAEDCQANVPGFEARYWIESPWEGDATAFRTGRMDIKRIVAEQASEDPTAYFLSGPKAMIDRFQQSMVQSLGVSERFIFIDAWE